MKKVTFSKDEFEYLRDVIETEDILLDSLKPDAKRNKVIKSRSYIVDSIKEKLNNAESSNISFI